MINRIGSGLSTLAVVQVNRIEVQSQCGSFSHFVSFDLLKALEKKKKRKLIPGRPVRMQC